MGGEDRHEGEKTKDRKRENQKRRNIERLRIAKPEQVIKEKWAILETGVKWSRKRRKNSIVRSANRMPSRW